MASHRTVTLWLLSASFSAAVSPNEWFGYYKRQDGPSNTAADLPCYFNVSQSVEVSCQIDTQVPSATVLSISGCSPLTVASGPTSISTLIPGAPVSASSFSTTYNPGYVTSYVPIQGTSIYSSPITESVIPPSGNNPGTIFLGTPTFTASYVTETEVYASSTNNMPAPPPTALPQTTTVSAVYTTPGTVIVYEHQTITLTLPYSGTAQISAPITTTLPVASTDIAQTVEVLTPTPSTVTSTIGYSGVITTSFLTQPSGSSAVTLFVETPYPFSTITTG